MKLSKEGLEHVSLLVLGSCLIFLGIMFAGHCLHVWHSKTFLIHMWPCLIIAPAYIHLKQKGANLANILIIGNSVSLLLYASSFLDHLLLAGFTGGFTCIILGIWVLSQTNESS